MPWDLEVVFSGLCLMLPDGYVDGEETEHKPMALLVRTAEGTPTPSPPSRGHASQARSTGSGSSRDCSPPQSANEHKHHHHRHLPRFLFDPTEVVDADFGVDLHSKFEVLPALDGDQIGVIDLEGKELVLECQCHDPYEPNRRRGPGRNAPSNAQEAAWLDWLVSLQAIDQRIGGIKATCFGPLASTNPVTSRMVLPAGTLQTNRIGRNRRGNPELYEFFPNQTPTPESLIQALADQVVLRVEGLRGPAKFTVRECHADGPVVDWIEIPRAIEPRRTVRVVVSNLPASLETVDSDVLAHFYSFYDLVTWSTGTGNPPCDLSAPKKFLATDLGGISANSPFCPNAQP